MKNRGKTAAGPKFVTCYLCNQQFGSTSLPIHQQSCYKKQYSAWLSRSKTSRVPPPTHPSEVPNHGIGLAQSHTSRGDGGELPKPQAVVGGLVPCSTCGRTFAPDRIDKHEAVCDEGKSKRAVFNTRKQRLNGTEVNVHSIPASVPHHDTRSWKQNRQGFLRQIRNAKQGQTPRRPREIEIYVPDSPPPQPGQPPSDSGALEPPPRRGGPAAGAPRGPPPTSSYGAPQRTDSGEVQAVGGRRAFAGRSDIQMTEPGPDRRSSVADRTVNAPGPARRPSDAPVTTSAAAAANATAPVKFATRRGAAPVVSAGVPPPVAEPPPRGAEVPRPRDFAERTTAPAEPERPTTRRSTTPLRFTGGLSNRAAPTEEYNNGGSSRAAHRSSSASASTKPTGRGSEGWPAEVYDDNAAPRQRRPTNKPPRSYHREREEEDQRVEFPEDPYTARLYAEYLARKMEMNHNRAWAQPPPPPPRRSSRQEQRDAFEYELELRYELEARRGGPALKGAWQRGKAVSRSHSHGWPPPGAEDDYPSAEADGPTGGARPRHSANDGYQDARGSQRSMPSSYGQPSKLYGVDHGRRYDEYEEEGVYGGRRGYR